MINFDRVPIIKGLELYKSQNNSIFHMPGHKQNIANMPELEFLKHNLYRYDVTEVPGTDNLFQAEEIIGESLKLLAEAMGSSKSHMLVNGSTCGIYAMMLGLLNKKDKVIVQRNCHKSVHTAIYLGDLDCAYVYPKFIDEFNIPSTVDIFDLQRSIEENEDAKAVIITSPTYYGTCADIRSIAKLCKEKGMLLLVDEAHGAHFNFSRLLPDTAINLGADIAVSSFHKTLPACTQTAVLNLSSSLSINQIENIESKLEMFQSSSPSYILLASIDMARYIMQEKGEKLIESLKSNINYLKEALKDITDIKILDESYLDNERHDFTRLVINTPINGNDLSILLRDKYKIQVEMADFNNIVLIGTVSDIRVIYEKTVYALRDIFISSKSNRSDKKTLKNAQLKALNSEQIKVVNTDKPIIENNILTSNKKLMIMPKTKSILTWNQAEQHKRELIDILQGEGRIAAESLVPYPPGVPLVLPGEQITNEVIDYIQRLKTDNLKLTKSLSANEIDKVYVIKC